MISIHKFYILNGVYLCVYTMVDIYENTILCSNCNTPLEKAYAIRGGFKLRSWVCPNCKEQILHPKDEELHRQFVELKKREFEVKLRQVGNSWAVSIPKEIIKFEDVTETKVIKMSMDEPGKL